MSASLTMAGAEQDFAALLARARNGDQAAQGELLEPLREFLRMLAARQLDARLSGRIDASDIVHETYITALESLAQFRGTQRPEFLAWLRTVHEHVMQNLAREHIGTQKRSIRREQPLASTDLPQLKALIESTPSGNLLQAEAILQLIEALDTLSADQRTAIRLRYFESWTVERISAQMQRSLPAVAGLLKRGLKTLRSRLAPLNGQSVTSGTEESHS